MQVLNLSSNNLRVLPAFFSELQALVKLVLSSTHLLALPNYISSLTCLEHMELASNKLQVCAKTLLCLTTPSLHHALVWHWRLPSGRKVGLGYMKGGQRLQHRVFAWSALVPASNLTSTAPGLFLYQAR